MFAYTIKKGGLFMNLMLRLSLEQEVPLEMIYLSKNGAITQRRIKVLQIQNGYIRAYCYLRKMNRTFKIDDILSAQLVNKTEHRIG
jgi:predicted DNA-binding transcriptional regulator YafY